MTQSELRQAILYNEQNIARLQDELSKLEADRKKVEKERDQVKRILIARRESSRPEQSRNSLLEDGIGVERQLSTVLVILSRKLQSLESAATEARSHIACSRALINFYSARVRTAG